MKKVYNITVEVTASSKENQQAFDALVNQSLEALKKAVADLQNVVSVKGVIAESAPAVEAPAAQPAPAPAPPKA